MINLNKKDLIKISYRKKIYVFYEWILIIMINLYFFKVIQKRLN